MLEDWKAVFESVVFDAADFLVSTRVRSDFASAQYFVEVWVSFVEMSGGSETVDKSTFATRAIGVGEKVEHLETAWIGEVCCVSVDWESESSVCGVGGVDGGGEVPESAVLGWSDKGDAV